LWVITQINKFIVEMHLKNFESNKFSLH
jgi:hypothetical protein